MLSLTGSSIRVVYEHQMPTKGARTGRMKSYTQVFEVQSQAYIVRLDDEIGQEGQDSANMGLGFLSCLAEIAISLTSRRPTMAASSHLHQEARDMGYAQHSWHALSFMVVLGYPMEKAGELQE